MRRKGGGLLIPWELALAFFLGLALLYLLGTLLLIPMRFLWRLMAGSLLGALALFVINQFFPITGLVIPVNLFTVLLTGFLGLPGVALTAGLTIIL